MCLDQGESIMWTLLIISTVIGLDEPKVTRYAEYEYAWQCEDNWRLLNYEFKNNEIAFCEGPK